MAVTAETLSPLPPLRGEQRTASRPDSHVWLSASAGTGKTQVLAARVFRLLLRGVSPGAILCLTFTKAGAAEMAARISQRLAAWVRMPETALGKDLIALGEEPTSERIALARTLFARVLDAPGGGLRIQTIHGFCQGLLAAFPVEAGLVPGFRPIEPREEVLLMRQSLGDLLVDAEREGRTGPAETIGALSVRLGEEKAESFLRDCARAGRALEALPSGIAAFVRRELGLPAGDVEEAIREECAGIDSDALELIAQLNREWGTKGGIARAEVISLWLAADLETQAATLADLHTIWAKADGDPRSRRRMSDMPNWRCRSTRMLRRCSRCGCARPSPICSPTR